MKIKKQPDHCHKVCYPDSYAANQALEKFGRKRGAKRAYRCGKHLQETWHLTSRE